MDARRDVHTVGELTIVEEIVVVTQSVGSPILALRKSAEEDTSQDTCSPQ